MAPSATSSSENDHGCGGDFAGIQYNMILAHQGDGDVNLLKQHSTTINTTNSNPPLPESKAHGTAHNTAQPTNPNPDQPPPPESKAHGTAHTTAQPTNPNPDQQPPPESKHPVAAPKKKLNKREARKARKALALNNKSQHKTHPYTTFIETATQQSVVGTDAGLGLICCCDVAKFTWIGLYPGDVTTRRHRKRNTHTMETSTTGTFIVADPAVKTGVHMVNEATSTFVANTFYVKLPDETVLYFAGTDIKAGTELLTCYSKTYGKRPYPISKSCMDPRCANSSGRHRTSSGMLAEWLEPLLGNRPMEAEAVVLR